MVDLEDVAADPKDVQLAVNDGAGTERLLDVPRSTAEFRSTADRRATFGMLSPKDPKSPTSEMSKKEEGTNDGVDSSNKSNQVVDAPSDAAIVQASDKNVTFAPITPPPEEPIPPPFIGSAR